MRVFKVSVAWAAVGATGMILGAVYLLTLVQKVFWGSLKVEANRGLTDINGWELAGALPLIAFVIYLGVYPMPLLKLVESSAQTVVEMAQLGAGR